MKYIVVLSRDAKGKANCVEFDSLEDARAKFPSAEIWPAGSYNYIQRGREILDSKLPGRSEFPVALAPIQKKSWWKFWKK